MKKTIICSWCGMPKDRHTEYGWIECRKKKENANRTGYRGGGIG